MDRDYIVRVTAADAQIRAFAATTRNLVEEMREIHNTSPVVSAALGRMLTGGAMMGAMMKGEDDLLTLQVIGDGPIGGMTVTADAKGNVKGYANETQVLLPASAKGKLDVGTAVGKGSLRDKGYGVKRALRGADYIADRGNRRRFDLLFCGFGTSAFFGGVGCFNGKG